MRKIFILITSIACILTCSIKAAQIAEKVQDDYRSCPICFEDISEDKTIILDCKHNFCMVCIKTLKAGKKEIQCPLCRTQYGSWTIEKVMDRQSIGKNNATALLMLGFHHQVIDSILESNAKPGYSYLQRWDYIMKSATAPAGETGYPVGNNVEHYSIKKSYGEEVWDQVTYNYWIERDDGGNVVNAGWYERKIVDFVWRSPPKENDRLSWGG